VKRQTLLQLDWRGYRLTAVGQLRELWPPSASVTTQLRLDPVRPDMTVNVLGVAAVAVADLPLSRPVLHEDAVVDVYLEGPGPATLSVRPRAQSAELVHSNARLQHYRVSYRGAVGDVDWTWLAGDGQQRLRLEVFPSKLDYRRDYVAIRDELMQVAPQLVLSVTGQAGQALAADATTPQQVELEWLEHVRRERQRLADGMARLLPRLRSEVRLEQVVLMSDRARRSRPAARRDYRLLRPGATPRPLAVEVSSTTVQTPINGYLRWELDQLVAKTSAVLAQGWVEKADEQIQDGLRDLARAAGQWQQALADIVPVPHAAGLHIRMRDPRYAAVLSAIRRLRQGLEPNRDEGLVGLKDLPTLYEYWVYLTVVSRLRQRYPQVVSEGRSLVRRVGGELVMSRGALSRFVLRDDSGRQVTALYNRKFGGLPTTAQQPDAVIQVEDQDGLLIIDAKYRLGRDREYLARYGCEGPLEEDINVLHRYRDALVHAESPYQRRVAAGLIAFPGRDTRKYRAHRFCRSWPAVWVGGVPLLPGSVELLDECLDQFFAMRLSHAEPSEVVA
jgi:hypothetical protein